MSIPNDPTREAARQSNGQFGEQSRSAPEASLPTAESVLDTAEVRSMYAWGDVPTKAQGRQAEADFDAWLRAQRDDAVTQYRESILADAGIVISMTEATPSRTGDLIEYKERGHTRRGIDNGDGTASHFTTRDGRRAVNIVPIPTDREITVAARAGSPEAASLAEDLNGAPGSQGVAQALLSAIAGHGAPTQ